MAVSQHHVTVQRLQILMMRSTRSRTIRNSTSARVSVPSLLHQLHSVESEVGDGDPWTWRTDLAATQPFWEGWFTGLSKKFLEAKGGKLLLLAGTDRLDKELMIGQMQGANVHIRYAPYQEITDFEQENISFKYFQKLVISSTKTKPRRLLR